MFWVFVKTKFKSGFIITSGEIVFDNPEAINNYFQSVFDNSYYTDFPGATAVIDNVLGNTTIDQAKVCDILLSADVTKSCGPDIVSGLVRKECALEHSIPLDYIFIKSLKSGQFPSLFRQANNPRF